MSLLMSAFAAFGAMAPTPASAAPCTALDRTGTTCRLGQAVNPGRPRPGAPTVRSSSPPGPTFMWASLSTPCDASSGGGWTPFTGVREIIADSAVLFDGSTAATAGIIWVGELVDPVTGPTNSGFISCVGAGNGVPAFPPPLPTAEEIWGAALVFEPEVSLDPYVRGLTGLETFMWYDGVDEDSVSITLNGYSVTATINAVEFRWDMGGPSREGEQHYSSDRRGGPDDPAAEHVYALPGEQEILHEIVWTGTAVATGPGLPPGGVTIDLGEAVLATARQYEVIEVRTPVVRGD